MTRHGDGSVPQLKNGPWIGAVLIKVLSVNDLAEIWLKACASDKTTVDVRL